MDAKIGESIKKRCDCIFYKKRHNFKIKQEPFKEKKHSQTIDYAVVLCLSALQTIFPSELSPLQNRRWQKGNIGLARVKYKKEWVKRLWIILVNKIDGKENIGLARVRYKKRAMRPWIALLSKNVKGQN